MYGSTPNPWNGAFNAGGGAGGAAAALALGTTMLSGGLDLLGLTPVAAASCGVVAFRPSYGRIPLVYPFALDTYGHFAPMARTVADCALLYDQLAGPPGADPALLPSAPRMTPVAEGLEGIRIGWSTDFGGYDVDQDVAANTARAADDLRSAGAELIEVELSLDPEEIGDTLLRHTGHMALPMMARHYARKELMTPHTVAFFDRCREAAQSGSISDAMEVEMRLYEILSQVFSECDALVGPSLAIPAFPLVPDMDDFTRVLCGAAFNICSRHPFVSVPSGFASNGVPTGLIVVAPRYEEATALRVSGAYEKVRRWTPRTP
jgi:aspartyl-tRNA(Asn)/glutamyl-tRNA(Gln) amidotransferase subunit A